MIGGTLSLRLCIPTALLIQSVAALAAQDTPVQLVASGSDSPLQDGARSQDIIITKTVSDPSYSAVTVQNSQMDAQSVYGMTISNRYRFADNVRSTLHLDNQKSGLFQHGAAYGAYVYNACKKGAAPYECNGVGLFSQAISGISTAQSWPINTACNDDGFPSSCGNEHDVTVQNTSAIYTLWAGIIQGQVQPGNANGIQLSQVPGSVAQWTYGFTTGDGAARNFASAGALALRGSAVPSQPFWMNSFDRNGRTHAIGIQALDHALVVSDNTRRDNIQLELNDGHVSITSKGSSPNVDINIVPTQAGRNIAVLTVKGSGNSVSPGNPKASLGGDQTPWSTVHVRQVQLEPTTFSSLPPCSPDVQGGIAFITDAKQPIMAWHQTVTQGGGSYRAFISCSGSTWHAFDY